MEKEVHQFIRSHQLIKMDTTILVGVSGGPDSMALLHFLCSIRKEWRLKIIALSVDHGLRGDESKQDVDYVKRICEKWNVQFHAENVDVPTYKANQKMGTQEAARKLRFEFFEQQMQKLKADYLALGHHADDQAETMLMRFVRGTNPDGLVGIPIKRSFGQGLIIRPLLAVSKTMIETYCKNNGINPRRDPSNDKAEYTRNYFRIHILPLLKKQNPNLLTTTQRMSEVVAEDNKFLNEQAEMVLDKTVQFTEGKLEAIFEVERFQQHSIALQRRCYHLILNYLYQTVPSDVNYIHEDLFFSILHNEKPNVSIDFPLGLKVMKSYSKVIFHFDDEQSTTFSEHLHIPGHVLLPDGSRIVSSITENPLHETEDVYVCPFEGNQSPLLVRTRKPGDRMRVRGLNGSKKIKDIFIDEKIPVYKRQIWPVIEDKHGNILWLVGLKKGILAPSNAISGKFLQLHYKKNGNK